jgi:hypothetical protein
VEHHHPVVGQQHPLVRSREGAIAVPAVLAVGIPRSFDDCCCGDDGASVVDAVDRPLVGQALQLVGPTIVECQA